MACRYAKSKASVGKRCSVPRFEPVCLDAQCRRRACVPLYSDVESLYARLSHLLVAEPYRLLERDGAVLMATIAYTGCRLGECLRLTLEDVGGLGSTDVPQSHVRLYTEKRRHSEWRLVPIPPSLTRLIQMYAVRMGISHSLFPYAERTARRLVEKAGCELVKAAWAPHALRHAWAIKLITMGTPLTMIRYWGGWADTETPLEVYARYVAAREASQNPWLREL